MAPRAGRSRLSRQAQSAYHGGKQEEARQPPPAAGGEGTGSKAGDGRRRPQQGFDYRGFDDAFEIEQPPDERRRLRRGIVARVRADRPMYLRVRTFDRFDGERWSRSSARLAKLALERGRAILRRPSGQDPDARPLGPYQVFIEQPLGDYIPAAAVPARISFPATAIGLDLFGGLRAPGMLREGTVYTVESITHLHQGRVYAEQDYRPLPGYLQLPPDLDPRIADLAERVTGQAMGSGGSEEDRAIALERHLRQAYRYDLESTFTSQGRTPLARFLFETRSGHCEYFASALAVMLRTQGIPARLVTGFSATNRNPLTGYYDIHAIDGHAWVEAYVDRRGWLILEPTPFYAGPGIREPPLSARQVDAYVERQARLREVLGYADLSLTGALIAGWQSLTLAFTVALGYLKALIVQHWRAMLAVLAALVLAGWAYRRYLPAWRSFRLMRRVRSFAGSTPRDSVAFYLDAIDALLHHRGHVRPPRLTIERYLAWLATLEPLEDATPMAALFNDLFYGAQPPDEGDPEAYRRLFMRLYESA